MKLEETTIRKIYVYRGRILNLRNDDALLPNGKVCSREVVEHNGGVCVLPVTDGGQVLFVRQYRYPYSTTLLELPAGKLERGEDPFTAGVRELREETGYEAETYYDLGCLYPSPGYTDEVIHLYAAEGLTAVGQDLDDDEFLNVETFPLAAALRMAFDGTLVDAKTLAALFKYDGMKRGIVQPAVKTANQSAAQSVDRPAAQSAVPCGGGKPELVLASGSPRRRALLRAQGYSFTVCPADFDESKTAMDDPAAGVQALALGKALAAREQSRAQGAAAPAAAAAQPSADPADPAAALYLGADTVVVYDGKVLGKPASSDEARSMLAMLSGKVHTVYTGAALVSAEKTETFVSATQVEFYPLTAEDITDYIATGEPLDKAGAYGIQGKGAALVRSIDGDYSTVVGLPLAEVCRKLSAYGVQPDGKQSK